MSLSAPRHLPPGKQHWLGCWTRDLTRKWHRPYTPGGPTSTGPRFRRASMGIWKVILNINNKGRGCSSLTRPLHHSGAVDAMPGKSLLEAFLLLDLPSPLGDLLMSWHTGTSCMLLPTHKGIRQSCRGAPFSAGVSLRSFRAASRIYHFGVDALMAVHASLFKMFPNLKIVFITLDWLSLFWNGVARRSI